MNLLKIPCPLRRHGKSNRVNVLDGLRPKACLRLPTQFRPRLRAPPAGDARTRSTLLSSSGSLYQHCNIRPE